MDKITWSDDFSIGDKSIDKQHKKIIELINTLTIQYNDNVSSEIIEIAIKDIVQYSEHHLKYEEEMLNRIEYPEYYQHKELHFTYLEKLSELSLNVGRLENKQFLKKLLKFLKDWWTHHILEEDMAYKSFLETS